MSGRGVVVCKDFVRYVVVVIWNVVVVFVEDCVVFEFGVLCEVFGIDCIDEGVFVFDFWVCGECLGEFLVMGVGVMIIFIYGLDVL